MKIEFFCRRKSWATSLVRASIFRHMALAYGSTVHLFHGAAQINDNGIFPILRYVRDADFFCWSEARNPNEDYSDNARPTL